MPDAHHDEIAKLESLYEENPEGRVFTHLAEAYRKGGELERAHEVLSDGIERHPNYSSAHVVLGRVLMDQDRTSEAEESFQRVLELDPHNLIAIRSLGDLARSRGNDDRALEFYRRLLDQEPGEDEVREIVDEMTTGLTVPDVAGQTGETGLAGESGGSEESETPTVSWESEWAGAGGATSPVDEDEDEDEAEAEERVFSLGPGTHEGGAANPVRDDADAEVRTETIAQVYARQGLYDRAAEVYRELVRSRPDDEGLRERLAEVEQLARAQTEGVAEVDAIGEADAMGEADTISGLEEAETERLPGLEAAGEPEAPREEVGAGSFGLEGFESGEVDTSGVEATALPGIEVDEADPETGLRADVEPDPAASDEDLSGELEVTDVPQPPEEAPWGGDLAVGAGELDGLDREPSAEGEDREPESPELEGADSVWTGADWPEESDEETTPHAWTDEEEEEDTSLPIREYLGGLLSWSASGGASDRAATTDAPLAGTAEAESTGTAEGAGAGGPEATGMAEGAGAGHPEGTGPAESTGTAAGGGTGQEPSEGDDDLDMFRSWLESLKQ